MSLSTAASFLVLTAVEPDVLSAAVTHHNLLLNNVFPSTEMRITECLKTITMLCVKIQDQQFQKQSNQHIWHQQPRRSQDTEITHFRFFDMNINF